MILSMTGYGAAQTAQDGVTYSVEIRSVNNRYYKAGLKLPEALQALEPEIDGWLRARMGRGTVSYALRVRDESPAAAYQVNASALQAYVERLRQLRLTDASTTIDLANLLNLPGVCEAPDLDEATREARKAIVHKLTQAAMDQLIEMRRIEGRLLRQHLLELCDQVDGHRAAIGRRAPLVPAEYGEKLKARVARLLQQAQLDLDRDTMAREVAVYADRCDINEELQRLGSHLDQFRALCDSDEEAGRKLDFLAQEMLREANTIGSKSNDATISRHVVEIKAAIDRLKEQVQNVE